MSSPQVSVVLPTHNRAAILPRAIGSVLGQTFPDLELIVVDDASTDGTAQVVEAIEDPRIVYVRLTERAGAAVARNNGIRRARGPLVAFQDSDDEWLPTKLQHQLALMTSAAEPLRAVGGRYRAQHKATEEEIAAPNLEQGSDYEEELLDGPCCITPVWVIERTLLQELGLFDERMPCLEDWDLMLRLSERTRMRAVPYDVLIKRGAGDNLGANLERRSPAMEELLRRHGARFLAHPRRHASFCLELSYLCFVSGRRRRAARYALRALRRRGPTPAMLRSFVRACLHARSDGRPTWPIPGVMPGH